MYIEFSNPVNEEEIIIESESIDAQLLVDTAIESTKDVYLDLLRTKAPSRYNVFIDPKKEVGEKWGNVAIKAYNQAASSFEGEWNLPAWKDHIEPYLQVALEEFLIYTGEISGKDDHFYYENWIEEHFLPSSHVLELRDTLLEIAEEHDIDAFEVEDIFDNSLKLLGTRYAGEYDKSSVFTAIHKDLTCEIAYMPGYTGDIKESSQEGSWASSSSIEPNNALYRMLEMTNISSDSYIDHIKDIDPETSDDKWIDFNFIPELRTYPVISISDLSSLLDQSVNGGTPCYSGRVNVGDWILSNPQAVKICKGGLIGLIDFVDGNGSTVQPTNKAVLDSSKGSWEPTRDISIYQSYAKSVSNPVRCMLNVRKKNMEIQFTDYKKVDATLKQNISLAG